MRVGFGVQTKCSSVPDSVVALSYIPYFSVTSSTMDRPNSSLEFWLHFDTFGLIFLFDRSSFQSPSGCVFLLDSRLENHCRDPSQGNETVPSWRLIGYTGSPSGASVSLSWSTHVESLEAPCGADVWEMK